MDQITVLPDTEPRYRMPAFPRIRRGRLETLQVNLGYRCNQACHHCHVDAGPNRTEAMDRETVDLVVRFLAEKAIACVDITGGAPELNPHFRDLVAAARGLGASVIDRCNLTILDEPGQSDLAGFLAANRVQVIASLPCYTQRNVEAQRGKGVFAKSIRALRSLNEHGYGIEGTGLQLNLVYNPVGAFLPPNQQALEATYKRELDGNFGVKFNGLLTLCNMPIERFRRSLVRDGLLDEYLQLLSGAHSDANLDKVMCRTLVSVDWRGYVYDCDFNQMLRMPLGTRKRRIHLSELIAIDLTGADIAVADHCYGCTAGQGSSCGGALSA